MGVVLDRWLAAFRPPRLALGEPIRIASDVTINFRGRGMARFRLQHARDDDGQPDDLSWCDVTAICDRRLDDPRRVIDRDDLVHGMLVDVVDGDGTAFYRRHRAGWLRVVPLDDNKEAEQQCQAYVITVRPCRS